MECIDNIKQKSHTILKNNKWNKQIKFWLFIKFHKKEGKKYEDNEVS